MYSPSEIITYARKKTGCTTNEMDDTEMYVNLNDRYFKLYRQVLNIDKNLFWSQWTADSVDNQSEYSLAEPDWSTDPVTWWIMIPEKVYIKYSSTSTYYTECRKADFDHFVGEDMADYEANQSQSDPFFITLGRYVRIYPAPDWAVTDWIKFEWARKPFQLTSSHTTAHILLPDLYKLVLGYGLCVDIYENRKDDAKANNWIVKYDKEVAEMLHAVSMQSTKVVRSSSNPDLDRFH